MLHKKVIIYGVQKVPLVGCSRLLIQYNLSYPTY